jgi:hypothetical protein
MLSLVLRPFFANCLNALQNEPIKSMINKLIANPKHLFLIDALGALITAATLTIVAIQFPDFFGLPSQILFALAGIAFTFSIYSFSCYYFFPGNWRRFLVAIILANTFYIVVTIALVLNFFSSVTTWGLLYFAAEMLVIGCLIYVERKALHHNQQKQA